MLNVRNDRFDFYKGMLIIGVVWGHVITALKAGSDGYTWIQVFLRTYDMPMFAFVSGIFLKKSCQKRGTIKNITNKLTTIFFPIIIWNLFFNLLSGNISFSVSRFWFLWSILICSCLIIFIYGITKNHKSLFLLLAFCSLVVTHVGIPFLEAKKVGFLLFPCLIGFYYENFRKLYYTIPLNIRKYIKPVLLFLFVVAQCFWSQDYNVWNAKCDLTANGEFLRNFFIMTFRGIIGILGCFTMKTLFDFIYDFLNHSNQYIKISNSIVCIGKYTMEIYILQTLLVENYGKYVIIKISEIIGFNPFVFNMKFLGVILAPIIAIVSITVCYFIQMFIRKIPFIKHFIFGGTIDFNRFFDKFSTRTKSSL